MSTISTTPARPTTAATGAPGRAGRHRIAAALAARIEAAARRHAALDRGDPMPEETEEEEAREDLENELIPWSGFFLGARAFRVTREPLG